MDFGFEAANYNSQVGNYQRDKRSGVMGNGQ